MAVSEEQWAIVATEHDTTLQELKAHIAKINSCTAALPEIAPMMFDRDLDPLTLGEWSALFASPSYRFLADTTLPDGRWVATIWEGINADFDDPPIVMETSLFPRGPAPEKRLPSPTKTWRHRTEVEALETHHRIVAEQQASLN